MDVKTLCLGVLTLGEFSGYEIKKQFEEGPFAYFHQAGFGSIYPALGKLNAEGLVSCTEMAQDKRPDKKVYSITPAGLEAFRKALGKNPARDKIQSESVFMMFFANHLDEDHLRSVYEGYLDLYRANLRCLNELDDTVVPTCRRFTRGLGRAMYRAVVDYMETNRRLLLGDGAGGDPPGRDMETEAGR